MLLVKHYCSFMESTLDLLCVKQHVFADGLDGIELIVKWKFCKIDSTEGTAAKSTLDIKALKSYFRIFNQRSHKLRLL